MAMEPLFSAWRAVAEWAFGQPVLIRLLVGSATLSVAYLLFVVSLSPLMRLGRTR